MDRMRVSGTLGVGSIPSGATLFVLVPMGWQFDVSIPYGATSFFNFFYKREFQTLLLRS